MCQSPSNNPHTHTHACTYTCMHIHMHVHTNTHARTHARTQTTHLHARIPGIEGAGSTGFKCSLCDLKQTKQTQHRTSVNTFALCKSQSIPCLSPSRSPLVSTTVAMTDLVRPLFLLHPGSCERFESLPLALCARIVFLPAKARCLSDTLACYFASFPAPFCASTHPMHFSIPPPFLLYLPLPIVSLFLTPIPKVLKGRLASLFCLSLILLTANKPQKSTKTGMSASQLPRSQNMQTHRHIHTHTLSLLPACFILGCRRLSDHCLSPSLDELVLGRQLLGLVVASTERGHERLVSIDQLVLLLDKCLDALMLPSTHHSTPKGS